MMILKSTLFKAMLCLCPVLLLGCGSSGSSSSSTAKVSLQEESSSGSSSALKLESSIVIENTTDELSILQTSLSNSSSEANSLINGSLVEGDSTEQIETNSNTGGSSNAGTSEINNAVDLNISWVDNSDNEVEFIIERRIQSNVDYGTTYYVAENITSYNDLDVEAGETYCYRVSASNSTGKSSSPEQCIDL